MQFKVPQFLEIEDKIFGPFTFKEFVYLAGGAGLCFVIFKLLGFLLGIIPMLAVAGFALALTFYKPNNKPFADMLESGFKYFTQNKLYVWKKGTNKKGKTSDAELEARNKNRGTTGSGPRLGGDKLRDLAWSLDVLDLNKHEKS